MNTSGSHTDSRKVLLLQALTQSRGIISSACQSASVPRRTFYNWLQTDREFRDSYEDIVEGALDFVENKLLERIAAGSEKAIFFFLKTRGRTRGYRFAGDSESDLLSENPVIAAYPPQRLRGRAELSHSG